VRDEQFTPTHRVPATGMPTWNEPDPNRAADNRLAPDLAVQVLEETTGWARVRCSNGWEAWGDATTLVPIARPAFTPTHRVPDTGLETRETPDVAQPANNRLGPGLPVAVVHAWGDWAKARCDNGWEAWVDGRSLLPMRTASPSPPALWLLVLGAAVGVLGGFLPWFSAGGESISAWDIEFVELLTHEESDFNLKTGVVLLLVVLAGLPLVTRRMLPRWAGVAVAGVATSLAGLGFVLYFDLPEPRPDLGIGIVLTLVGAIVMAAGALLSPRAGTPLARSA
jgi:SH3-like domain-containing protein